MVVKNKRASLPTITLVVLTLFLTISALLIFYLNAGKAVQTISDGRAIEEVYVKEDLAGYYVYAVGSDLISNKSLSKESFTREFSKINFEEDYLIALQKTISEGNFTIDEKHFELDEKSFASYYFDENLRLTYVSNLFVDLDKTKEQEYYLNAGKSIDDASLDSGAIAA